MALAANTFIPSVEYPNGHPFPVNGTSLIYQGALVCVDTDGYLVPAALTASLRVVGIANDPLGKRDNTLGADAAIDCVVEFNKAFWIANDTVNPVVQADVGGFCYVKDDQYVRTFVGAGVNVPVGRVLDIDTAKGVLVYISGLATIAAAGTDLALSGDLTVGGNASITGTLGVTGVATFTAAPVLSAGAGVAAGQAITGAGALTIGVAAGAFDLNLKLGDAAGAQKLSVLDSAGTEVARITSLGDVQLDRDLAIGRNGTVAGTLGVTGVLTASTGLVVSAGGATITAGGLTVTAGGATITAGGLSVVAGGAAITGNSTITGTLGVTGILNGSTAGVRSMAVNAAITEPPTAAELTAAFGATPAAKGDGFMGAVRNTGGTGAVYHVDVVNGTWYYAAALTAAV